MSLSVILATHDRPVSLRRGVRSVLLQTHRPAEIVLVNDGRDEIPADIPDEIRASGVSLICLRRRRPSLPAARNAGLAAAGGEILLLLDDDHELPGDYLARLAAIYEADADGCVDVVCGRVVEPARPRRKHLWDRLMTLCGHLRWRPRRCLARSRTLPPVLREQLRPTRYLTGGATSMRRHVARAVGYDGGLGGYALGEDREFSYRATQRFATFMAPALLMVHHCEAASRPDDRTYGRMIVAYYIRIARNSLESGCGKWIVLGWNLAGLCLAHAGYALAGNRRYHWDVLCGMAGELWAQARIGIAECGMRMADSRRVTQAFLPAIGCSSTEESQARMPESPAAGSRIPQSATCLPDRQVRNPQSVRRVLMLFSRFDAGGAERIALDLLGRLRSRGLEVGAAAIYGGGQWAGRFAEAASFFRDGLACCRFDLLSILRTARLIRSERVDRVLIVDAVKNAMIAGLWGSALSGRAVQRVLWCHACPGHELSGRMAGFVDRLRRSAGRLDTIVCVADWQRRELEKLGVPGEKMTVIENGVELARFVRSAVRSPAVRRSSDALTDTLRADDLGTLPMNALTGTLRTHARRELGLPEDAFLLVQVANYWPEKDPAWLLEAFALARTGHTGQPLHLALVGRGMDGPPVRAAMEKLGLADAVTAAGYRDDVPRWLAAADAFVLASAHETQSIAAIEAMAAGLPVIVADIPGFEDLIRDGQTGLKCPPGDSAALAGCIRRLVDDPALRERLARQAMQAAAAYDIERAADRFALALK